MDTHNHTHKTKQLQRIMTSLKEKKTQMDELQNGVDLILKLRCHSCLKKNLFGDVLYGEADLLMLSWRCHYGSL
jgi:hypothetical protein